MVCNANSDGLLSSHPFPGRRGRLGRSGPLCVYLCVCVCVFMIVRVKVSERLSRKELCESTQVSVCFCVLFSTNECVFDAEKASVHVCLPIFCVCVFSIQLVTI